MKKRLVVLISNAGTGTNLQAIIDSIQEKKMVAEIVSVVSDQTDAYGLRRAKKAGVPTVVISKAQELLPCLLRLKPDYICLAGWKQMIMDNVIETYDNKIINIHPGLIPDMPEETVRCPDGSKGLWNQHKMTDKAIQNFFDHKATYAGSSVHFMTPAFDFGPVLGRCFEKIRPSDTVETLYTRLKKKENNLYVSSLIKLCSEN